MVSIIPVDFDMIYCDIAREYSVACYIALHDALPAGPLKDVVKVIIIASENIPSITWFCSQSD